MNEIEDFRTKLLERISLEYDLLNYLYLKQPFEFPDELGRSRDYHLGRCDALWNVICFIKYQSEEL